MAAAGADAASAGEICARLEAPNPMLCATGAVALAELSRGDVAAAWAAVAQPTEALEAKGITEPLSVLVPPALEALIALGELDRAERLLASFDGKARELDRASALATGAPVARTGAVPVRGDGCPLWAQRAREELAGLGRRSPRPGDLTPAEGRVAVLATQGLSQQGDRAGPVRDRPHGRGAPLAHVREARRAAARAARGPLGARRRLTLEAPKD